jgi:DNA-binding MurR/RpiR family transcriptional regulator
MKREFTIKDIADELRVSKPTVSKAIKEIGIEPKMVLSKYVLTEEEAEKVRNNILGIEAEETETAKKPQTDTAKTENKTENFENSANEKPPKAETTPQIIEILQTSITLLQKQLEIKDKQIESLTAQIQTLTMISMVYAIIIV